MKKIKFEIIVFLAGAIGMGLELVAARVLSPYVGSSNVVWTSIIGIILVSMSLGYLIGGKMGDKIKDKNKTPLTKLIAIAMVSVGLIPLFEAMFLTFLPMFVKNLIIAAIISAIILFSIPSFILATISPIVVKIKSLEEKEIGSLSGKISSLSTIGSICGTFLMGFVLIPKIGVSNIILGIICILFILLVLSIADYSKIKSIILSALVLIFSLFFSTLGSKLFKYINNNIILDTDSTYSRIWVIEYQDKENKKYKALQVDRGVESHLNLETGKMQAKYLEFYDLLDYYNKDNKNTMLIGGAAYTYPTHYLKKYEDKTIDVVEIDPKMTEIAKEHFDLDVDNPRLKIYHQDGRTFLNYNQNKYDTILNDAFKGLSAPFELTTKEAMLHVKRMLNENGMIITNVISAVEGKDAEFLEYEYATYKAVFDDVKLFRVKSNFPLNEKQNLILIGFKGKPQIDEEKYNEYKEFLDLEIKDFKTDKSPVTDDFCPIGN